jgi:hypothetical protein
MAQRIGPVLVRHHESQSRPGGKAKRCLMRKVHKTRDGFSVTRAYHGSEADGVGNSLDFSYYV